MRRERAGLAGQFENVHAGIGSVDDIDVAAIIGLHVIGLDCDLAAILPIQLDAALVRRRVIAGMKYPISFGWYGSRTSTARTPALK
jgi:hypothetical protein